jgi:hypothetical protein
MKTRALVIVGLLLCAGARAGLCADEAGTGAASFLNLPVDARGAALGDAVAGSARGGMALFQNPAGLGAGPGSVAFSHSLLAEGISYDVLAAAAPLRYGALGVGVQYLQYGSLAALDNTGLPAGSLSPRDGAASLGYGLALLKDVYLGAAGKYINSRISGSASALALDAGLLIDGDELSVGFAAQNLGKPMKFRDEGAPLPVNYRAGLYAHYSPALQWSVDINLPRQGRAWLGAGAEYALAKGQAWSLLARAGYNTAALDTRRVNGLSAGFGLARRGVALDYAFRTMGLLGSTHHFGLTCRLGK